MIFVLFTKFLLLFLRFVKHFYPVCLTLFFLLSFCVSFSEPPAFNSSVLYFSHALRSVFHTFQFPWLVLRHPENSITTEIQDDAEIGLIWSQRFRILFLSQGPQCNSKTLLYWLKKDMSLEKSSMALTIGSFYIISSNPSLLKHVFFKYDFIIDVWLEEL